MRDDARDASLAVAYVALAGARGADAREIATHFDARATVDETTRDERFAARVDRLHAEYCDAVVALFEKHKAEAGYGPEETLTMV